MGFPMGTIFCWPFRPRRISARRGKETAAGGVEFHTGGERTETGNASLFRPLPNTARPSSLRSFATWMVAFYLLRVALPSRTAAIFESGNRLIEARAGN